MTSPLCREVDEEVAVALLTRQPLSPLALTHLGECPACHREWQELSDVSGLLAATRDLELAPAVPAGPALLERLLFEVGRRRRSRRVAVVLAAAAAIVAVAVPLGVWLGTTAGGDHEGREAAASPTSAPAPGPVVVAGSATAPTTGIQAAIQVRRIAWGSQVTVSATGMPRDTVCRVVVVDSSGRQETAGSWEVAYVGKAWAVETVHTPADQIVRVNLVDDHTGALLLAVPVA